MKILVLALSLVALASATLRRNHNFGSLSSIDSHPYGRQLLDTISLQVKSGASVDRIIQLLDDLAEGLEDEQSDDDALNATRQADCDSDIEAYEETIESDEEDIDDADELLAEYTPELATTQQQLSTKQNEIAALTDEISEFTEAYEEDLDDYDERIEEHEQAIEALDQVLDLLDTLVGSEAGKGIAPDSVRIPAETAAGVFLETKADQATLERLIELLEEVEDNLKTGIEDDDEAQEEANSDYQALKKAMVVTLSDLSTAASNLTTYENWLTSAIAEQQEIIENAQTEIASTTDALNAKIAICEGWSEQYIADSEKRSEELALIAQVREIFTDQLGDVDDYLTALY